MMKQVCFGTNYCHVLYEKYTATYSPEKQCKVTCNVIKCGLWILDSDEADTGNISHTSNKTWQRMFILKCYAKIARRNVGTGADKWIR